MTKQLPDVSTIRQLLRITEADTTPTPTLDAAIPRDAIEIPSRKYVIVRLQNCDGEDTLIAIEGGTNYAIGVVGSDGVVDLIDMSYRSVEEAKAAWVEVDGKPTIDQNCKSWTAQLSHRLKA